MEVPSAKTSDQNYVTIKDYTGKEFRLYDTMIAHIKRNHPDIEDPIKFVTSVLQDPLFITQDELPNTVIYHRSVGKPLLHIAYVEVSRELVKSAHITDTVKGGALLWMKPTPDLIK